MLLALFFAFPLVPSWSSIVEGSLDFTLVLSTLGDPLFKDHELHSSVHSYVYNIEFSYVQALRVKPVGSEGGESGSSSVRWQKNAEVIRKLCRGQRTEQKTY